jgi:chromosome segregation ATPase
MVDMLKSSRDEDNKRRDETQFYNIQQQLDELRRQLKENLARAQWFEELYKQNEAKVTQVQQTQDRLSQDVAQAMHARQVEDGRMKAQLGELVQKVESPEKQLRELRAQIQGLVDSRKSDRDTDTTTQKQIDALQAQIREIHSHIGTLSDAQRQLRDLIQDLDSAIGEVRQEALHLAELQSLEEQRLRRQGVELQGLFETLRQQFGDVSAKSQRVDDVRRQVTERIEAVEEQLTLIRNESGTAQLDVERVEKAANEQGLIQQERLETVRVQLEAQVGEQRSVNDQRMDRIMSRFTTMEERLRATEQMLSELPSRFDALERRDEVIGTEADAIEEWLVVRQIAALEAVLDDARQRRMDRASTISPGTKQKESAAPGSVYNPAGLLKSVRDAKPPSRSVSEIDEESNE